MKYQSDPTERHKWQLYRDEMQLEVENSIESLRTDIEASNLYLAQQYTDGKLDEVNEFAHNAITEFNSRWKYHRDYFMVSGTWYDPHVSFTQEGVKITHNLKPTMSSAQSNGFGLNHVQLDGYAEEVPQIGYSFLGDSYKMGSHTFSMAAETFPYASIEDVGLHYMRPAELSEVVSADLEEIMDRLARADSLMELYTTDENSNFFMQSAKRQQKFFSDIIEMVEDTLPYPETFDHLSAFFSTPVVYFKKIDKYTPIEAPNTDGELELAGQVVGFTSLNLLPEEKARQFRSSDELIDPSCSLLAILEIEQQDFLDGEDFDENRLAYVPLRQATSFSAQLV